MSKGKDGVCKGEMNRSEKGKEGELKAVLKGREHVSSNSIFNHKLEKWLLHCCDLSKFRLVFKFSCLPK